MPTPWLWLRLFVSTLTAWYVPVGPGEGADG